MKYCRSNTYYDRPQFNSPTLKQLDFIARNKLAKVMPTTYEEADSIISEFVNGRRDLEPTPTQKKMLIRAGKWQDEMSRGEAFDAISAILKASENST
jgi:hypothetical protein